MSVMHSEAENSKNSFSLTTNILNLEMESKQYIIYTCTHKKELSAHKDYPSTETPH